MKKKIFTISIAVFILLFSTMLSAQGLFQEDEFEASDNETYDAVLRGGPGSGPPQPGTDASPLGDGIFILTALAGGYAFLKKRNTKKASSL